MQHTGNGFCYSKKKENSNQPFVIVVSEGMWCREVKKNSFGYQITSIGPKVQSKQWHFGENNTYDALTLIH